MEQTVKMCDVSKIIAATVFVELNGVSVMTDTFTGELRLVTDIEPKKLVYPEGWYYAKGAFRNKHTSTTGAYEEILMEKSSGNLWDVDAGYCTLDTAKTVKACDLSKKIVATVFAGINRKVVTVDKCDVFEDGMKLVTDIEPEKLTYLEGWYYSNGTLRSDGKGTNGSRVEIPMVKSSGEHW